MSDPVDDRHRHIVHADQVPWVDMAEVKRADHPGDRDRGHQFGARARMLARAAGGAQLGCTMYEVPAGTRSFPLHYHLGNEEAIFVLDGAATLRLGDRELPIRAGDYIALPTGPALAHQVINASGAAVRYLCMSTMHSPEVAVYPDSNKIGVFAASTTGAGVPAVRQFHRLGDSLPYYDGEDDPR
jgi:uncharacterized cupin superfamily protein